MKLLEDFYLFKALEKDDINLLKKISKEKSFSEGEIIFYKGDKPKHLLLLLSGCVKIYKHDFKENEVTIHNIKAQSFIAEMANYEAINYPANCVAEMDCKIVFIDYEKFQELFLKRNEFLLIFMKSFTKKIKSLETFISNSIIEDVDAKIAKFIFDNKEEIKKIKQIKIAQILNIRPETLSRKLKALKKSGILKDIKGTIEIKDEEELKNLF